MPQPRRADLDPPAPASLLACRCPWCGYAGIDLISLRASGFATCQACRRLSPLPAELAVGEEDEEFLEDTSEYDIVPSSGGGFEVVRR